MADPVSITAGALSALAAITKLSTEIPRFVSSLRGAAEDIASVQRELESISVALHKLKESEGLVPETLHKCVKELLAACTLELESIRAQLRKVLRSKGRNMRWTLYGRAEMDKKRVYLEGHKSALSLLLHACGLSVCPL
jgi:chromosome segregation ATPase